MFSKIAPVALLSAAVLAAPAPAPVLEERGLIQAAYCLAQTVVIGALQQQTQATAFCSKFLSIPVVTSTVTSTTSQTVTAVATRTVTSTTTLPVSTSTCAPQYANAQKRDVTVTLAVPTVSVKAATVTIAVPTITAVPTISAIPTPSVLAGLASSVISADCSCLNIPTSTVTSTAVKTNTVTATSTTTTTAAATATPTYVAKQLYDLNGTYTASNGNLFQLYPNLDFPGNDAYQGTCGQAGDSVTTPDGTFNCLSWNDCMDICATATWGCVGVSFVPTWNYCYLKNEVPGNGVSTCGTVQSEIVESALNIAQGNTYAVAH